jgi:aconitate hydratase
MPVDDRVGSTPGFVAGVYENMARNLPIVRERLNRPLTLSEKILLSHLEDPKNSELERGESYVSLMPDRVALQDVTGQMAILQFMMAGRERVAVPTTVHCDHLIQAYRGSNEDTQEALLQNSEVYQFLKSASAKYGLGFWKPGAGIIHQVMLENYAFPGGLIIGTDSHTPNIGGLAMLAIGVGGADGSDVMAGLAWEVKLPRVIGVHLTGSMSGWTSPKDVISRLAGILTVEGGTNAIIEYFGPGTEAISCTGKATICNMGAELGATTSVFPYDERIALYLRTTERDNLIKLADKYREFLSADSEVLETPEKFYDQIVEINLSELEPQVVGPHTPDLARSVSELAGDVSDSGYEDKLSAALIGSCTNSSYEDMSRAADIARQAIAKGVKMPVPLLVTPGSEQIRATVQRDGQISALEEIGATLLANACGPCIGQWRREEISEEQDNSIITSFNRNFPRRNDGRASTMNFIASPEMVVAIGLGGRLSFNPLTDVIKAPDGSDFKLEPPKQAPEVPEHGFVQDTTSYIAPPDDGSDVEVTVDPNSDRLQVLDPFPAWNGEDFNELPLLVKVKGKCTTDHISPAGMWLRYRGHLDNLSNNMLLGGVNAFSGESGKTINQITGENGQSIPLVARDYKNRGLRWVVVGDQNYGEGSSREHAAMSPRLLGAVAVVVRGFARIHEANLKKQGVLPLTFAESSDYDKVQETDRISLIGLDKLTSGKTITCQLHHSDGSVDKIELIHTLNAKQIVWFRAGSALNALRSNGI